MKIMTNNIGNYSPHFVKSNSVSAKEKTESEQLKTTQAEKTKTEIMTNEEKNFFINKYPEKTKEIIDYHFYNKTGVLSGVKIGSLLDRRG